MVTAQELKNMTSQQFTRATEKLPLEVRLRLAILAGAGKQGVSVYEGKDMSDGKFYNEQLDWNGLADLLNGAVN